MRKFIPVKLPGLNEMIQDAKVRIKRGSLYDANKRKFTRQIAMFFGHGKPFKNQVFINFTWVEPNRRRDPDNIAAAKKYIIDALVLSGWLNGDGWNQVKGWHDEFVVDKHKPGVLVDVKEI